MSEPNGVAMPQTTPQYQFNGINSNNTSRGSSPLPRASHIPSSQLPPMKSGIPPSQLPPTRSTVSGLVRNVSQLSVSSQNTPNVSPSKFSTSTPNEEKLRMSELSDNASSLVPNPDVPVRQYVSSDALNKNMALPKASNINSLPSNTISDTPRAVPSSQLNMSTPSKYFNENGPNFSNVINGSLQSNFRTETTQNFIPMQNSQVEKKSGEHGQNDSKKQTNSALNYPQQTTSTFSQSSTNTNSFIRSNPPTANSQLVSTNQLQSNSIAQSNIVLNSRNPSPYTFSGVSTSNQTNQTYPSQFNLSQSSTLPSQNTNSKPPVQVPQNTISKPSKPRYPQTLPSNLMQPQIPGGGIPPSSQYNASLHNPNLLSQSQAESSQSYLNPQVSFNNNSMPPNQSFYKPQVGLNGPASLPSSLPTKPGISANRYPAQAQVPLQNPPGQYPQQQQQQYPQQQHPQQLQYPQQQHMQYPQQQQKAQYPQQQQQQLQYPQQQNQMQFSQQQYSQTGPVLQSGFNRLWGTDSHDLLQLPNILPSTKVQPPQINLGQDALNKANCSPDVFRCTMTKIPETAALLQKARLPLGMLIHPFKDLNYLPVIQCNVIVRCRACRTYINPFVSFVDSKRWKCNLCYRINELPEEFQYDPVSKTYGDPSRRPEIKSSTIEYIAPAEYMLRPPQPAVYLFLIDVSRLAIESGYLEILCNILLEELKNIPGDARTQIGFLAYDSALHFFSLAEGLNQPHEMTVLDIEDVFLPTPDNLLVNLKDRLELVEDLLKLLPVRFGNTFDGNSALGAALQVAHKMMGPTGGRVTVFQAALPNIGPGAVTAREDPNQRSSAEVAHLNPANDFYKKLALDCSAQQVAVDLFIVNSQYVDIATVSGISRFSGGCINHFPLFKSSRPLLVDGFQKCLRRYLTRKIGFEAVMRVRCTRGLSIHTFHGNFFVRSTDLLSLPNVSPDAAFGMQVSIEENLSDCQTVCFQAALLYTSSKGERRIRVHTLCIPVASTLNDIIHSADQQCVVGLLAKMAVDRSMQSSLSDAREALINAAIDCLSAYKFSLNMGSGSSGLLVPECLKLLSLYISAILKHTAFRIGSSTRLDDRVKAMIDLKTKPLPLLLQSIYPDMYPIHNLENQEVIINEAEEPVPLPPRLQLTARCLENKGAFLLDCGDQILILVGPNVSKEFLNEALGVPDYTSITDSFCEIPLLDNPSNARLHHFINYLNDEKSYPSPLHVIRDNSPNRIVFLEKLVEDRLENSLSYHEFLQHLKTQVK